MRIIVADDHALFRDGIVSLLEAAGHEVIAQVGDGVAAVDAAAELNPDAILIDINMPKMTGIEALRAIKSANNEVHAILLTMSEDESDLVAAARAGANGYLLKTLDGEEFLRLLAGVERGEAALTQRTAARLLSVFSQAEGQPQDPDGLTKRELELLRLVAAGQSNKDIAAAIAISENTVKFHMKNILQKLDVSNRAAAVAVALQRGYLTARLGEPAKDEPTSL